MRRIEPDIPQKKAENSADRIDVPMASSDNDSVALQTGAVGGDSADNARGETSDVDGAAGKTAEDEYVVEPEATEHIDGKPVSPSNAAVEKNTKQAASTRRKGTILILVGVLLIVLAGVFFASSIFSSPSSIRYAETARYDVPDGLLQEGTVDSATDVVYLYDLDDGVTPYAVEHHAMEKGLLGERDLYSEWDGSSDFREGARGDEVALDVSNYRKIIVHLPSEAKGYVAGSDDAKSVKTEKIESQDGTAGEQDAQEQQ